MQIKSIPRWKYYLSYLFEFHVESASSPFNPHLYVSLKKGRYQLSTANAIYSYDDLYDNFDTAFNRLDWESLATQEVLLLGLGLGSVPFILENKWGIHSKYTAVEIDESVIYLAEKYRLSTLQSPVCTVCADALAFAYHCIESYDLIIVDLFQDDKIPEAFWEKDFLEEIKRIQNDNGLVLFNHLAITDEQKERSYRYFKEVFSMIFPQAAILQTRSNYIFVSQASKTKKS